MSTNSFDIKEYHSILQDPARVVLPFPWIEHIPFAFFLTEILSPEIIVELGVHTGNSYNAFCQATQVLKNNTKCYGVDTWKGEEHAGFYEENVFQDLNNYQKELYADFSFLLRCTFDEALSQFANGTIGLLHIDGLHTYEAVKHDFESWLPKVKDGGVIIFHDTQVRHGDFGVWKLWSEISGKYKSYEFKHCNGLGVILVGSHPKFQSFLEAINQESFLQKLFPFLGKTISTKSDYETLLIEKGYLLLGKENEIRELGYAMAEKDRVNAQIKEEAQFEIKDREEKIKDLEQEIIQLHAKADSMRIKNRIKRLFGK